MGPESKVEEFDLQVLYDLLEGGTACRRAISRAYERYGQRVMLYVRKRFPSLSEEDRAQATHDAFVALDENGREGAIDGDRPLLAFLFAVAFRRGRDVFRGRERRASATDEFMTGMAQELANTEVGRQWATAASAGVAPELQSEFRVFVPTLPKKQQIVASIIAEYLPWKLSNSDIREELSKRTGRTATMAEVKSALQVMRGKFEEIMEKKGALEAPSGVSK